MPQPPSHSSILPTADLTDAAWTEVLSAVDRTYAELVAHQEQLERQNRELEDLRQFQASVFASVSDVLIVLDRLGVVQEVNRSVTDGMGTPAAALLGQPLAALVDPADHAALTAMIAQVTRSRARAVLEFTLAARPDPMPVEAVLSPRLDDRGRVVGMVLTGRPVGELRRAYAQLEQSHAEMKAAQAQLVRGEKLASLGRLLAGVAHELNNPISFVYANAHALERYADRVDRKSTRLNSSH